MSGVAALLRDSLPPGLADRRQRRYHSAMQLFSTRVRLLLMLLVWLTVLAGLVLWLGSHQVQRLAIGGGPAGSESLELLTAISGVINEAGIGIEVRVFETGGSYENLRLLQKARLDMAEVQADVNTSDGVVGVMRLYRDAYHLVVRDDATVEAFPDLAGYRAAIPPGSSGQFKSFWFLASHYGLSPAVLNAQPMAEDAANFAIRHGQVDAVFRVRAPGNESIRRMISESPLHMVPITQADALALKQPALEPGIIPLGSYRGYPPQPELDLQTAVLDRLLVGRADLDHALVYRFTRAVFERRSEILERSRLGGFIGPLAEDDSSSIPAHPGARSYFDREKPGFMQQNARLASAVLYVVAIVTSALLALRTHWIRSRRVRMNEYNRRLMAVSHRVRGEHTAQDLLSSKSELMDILSEVVSELERERVNQDEFEHFSFAWQAVDALVRDQLNLVSTAPGMRLAGSATG